MNAPYQERSPAEVVAISLLLIALSWLGSRMLQPSPKWALEVVEFEDGSRRSRARDKADAAELAELVNLLDTNEAKATHADVEEEP